MNPPSLHPWTLDPQDAKSLQIRLRGRLVLDWDGRPVASIGGADIGYVGDQARAAIVVLRYPELTPLSVVTDVSVAPYPYTSGLLAFREGPLILAAWEQIPVKPDVLMIDGQGIAHPRRFGLAAHIGLWIDTPTIGIAKSHLYGHYAEVGPHVGDRSLLMDEDDPQRILGAVVRTRQKSKPLFISPGHLIDHETAVTFVLACCREHRLPETTRLAHQHSHF